MYQSTLIKTSMQGITLILNLISKSLTKTSMQGITFILKFRLFVLFLMRTIVIFFFLNGLCNTKVCLLRASLKR